MTLAYRSGDSDSCAAQALASYRSSSPQIEKQYKMPTPSSSSSSSSPSRIATPVDETHPMLITFPKHIPRQSGDLASSGSSSFSLERLGWRPGGRQRSISFVPRPPKLSLDTSKVRPVPALASASTDHSPLGAFGPTSSAERHLRSLIQDSYHAHPFTDIDICVSSSHPSPSSPSASDNASFNSSGRLPRSALRSLSSILPSPYDDDDSEPEHEAYEDNDASFWPPVSHRSNGTMSKSTKSRVAHLRESVPTISRSPSSSPPKSDSVAFASRPFLVSRHSSSAASPSSSHSRTASSPCNFASSGSASTAGFTRPRAGTTLSPPKVLRPRNNLLRAHSGPVPNISRKNSVDAYSTVSPCPVKCLNPALAAVEHSSRLRTRCVCVVCGKPGADFPRCPRCGVCWCTRECRMSEKETPGKHVCTKGRA